MPEGDSVLQLANRLKWMPGREVLHSDFRVPALATASITGERIQAVWPYGKHLFIQAGEQILHTHLKMEGVWAIHAAGSRWRRPGYTARVVLRLSPQHPGGPPIEVVGHELGFVRLYPARDYAAVVQHLGPDILDPCWASEEFRDTGRTGRDEALRRILRRPDRSLGAALLDQRNVAGIGNEYRAEVMFLIGLHPAVPVGRVVEEKVAQALDLARRVMWENRLEPHRVFTGDRRPGMGTFVFGRAAKPCRRCGETIEQSTLGGRFAGWDLVLDAGELERIIWWCPHCQPGGEA